MRVLVVNAGSSSVKLRLLDPQDTLVWTGDLVAEHGRFDTAALAATVAPWRAQVDAVGHRVVHGGTRFVAPVLLDSVTERAIRDLSDLAPLHQPVSLAGIDALRRALPDTPAVACFDTAFHATLPSAAATYAVPARWREDFGVRRYGFHGLSHAYVARRAAAMLGPRRASRLVSAHLGAGASLAAIQDGISVDTTMGFTPLDGLVMATRCGAVDPGLVPWLVDHAGMALGEVAEALESQSGILSLAGTADMAMAVAKATQGDAGAKLALEVYLHRLRAGIASMAAALGGLDALVFTGGVGERAPAIRAGAAEGLAFLGVGIDETANTTAVPDAEINVADSPAAALVITAREDLQIASEVRSVLAGAR